LFVDLLRGRERGGLVHGQEGADPRVGRFDPREKPLRPLGRGGFLWEDVLPDGDRVSHSMIFGTMKKSPVFSGAFWRAASRDRLGGGSASADTIDLLDL